MDPGTALENMDPGSALEKHGSGSKSFFNSSDLSFESITFFFAVFGWYFSPWITGINEHFP